jgi:hypothetical protein
VLLQVVTGRPTEGFDFGLYTSFCYLLDRQKDGKNTILVLIIKGFASFDELKEVIPYIRNIINSVSIGLYPCGYYFSIKSEEIV